MSESESWYAGFDVINIETTSWDEVPEEDGFYLLCPVEGCDHEAEFAHLGEITESEWSGLSLKDEILTDGTILKEAYCPVHTLAEDEDTDILPEMRQGLGIPLDNREQHLTPEWEKDEYAAYDFLGEGECVEANGYLLTCGCQSCYRETEFDSLDEAEQSDWICGQTVHTLTDGRTLFKGRCPEHRGNQ